jgi:hypothetical protein
MDFTLSTYQKLLNALRNQGFSFLTFKQFISNSDKKVIVLRQDVDLLPGNSLEFAKIQAELEIKGTYYFRIVPESFNEDIIREIALLGHEVGYHYEDLAVARQKTKVKRQKSKPDLHDHRCFEKVLVDSAIERFASNLEKLRKIAPVKTICMHGSPMSRWDNRLLWKYYDYKDFGIIGEPYFDINFDEVMYLTDTGRRWDGDSFNIRDKSINRKDRKAGAKHAKETNRSPITDYRSPFPRFHSTSDIIKAAQNNQLPDKIMMTIHPQRWTDRPLPWVKELVWQNVKNAGKYFLVKVR